MKNIVKISMLALIISVTASVASYAQVDVGIGISANIAPPELPVYDQPECPADGYLWTPGYWAYGDDGYYWVPGAWVAPPDPDLLWTPCYWGFDGGVYRFHAGYWGAHVGFYGGINYGFGYGGDGFYGGRWEGGHFRYNTAVLRVNTRIVHNTYVDRTVIHVNANRASFNGRGGIDRRPSASEQAAMRGRHIAATSRQADNQRAASKNRNQFAKVNHGKPATAAKSRITAQNTKQVKKNTAAVKRNTAAVKRNTATEKRPARTPKTNANKNNNAAANANKQQQRKQRQAANQQKNQQRQAANQQKQQKNQQRQAANQQKQQQRQAANQQKQQRQAANQQQKQQRQAANQQRQQQRQQRPPKQNQQPRQNGKHDGGRP